MCENQSYFATLLIVALVASMAALLLVATFVLWLAELMGSLIYPCLILGLILSLLATIIYKVSLRHMVREMGERLRVIYEVTKILREGAEWLKKLLFSPAQ